MDIKKIDKGLALILLFVFLVFITGALTELKFSDEIWHFWFAKEWFQLGRRPIYNHLVDTIKEFGCIRYYITAPLWHFGLAYLSKIWGNFSQNFAQFYQTLFYFLLIANTYLLAKELYGTIAARWAALIVATIPLFVSFGVLFFLDLPIAAWSPLLLFFMAKRKYFLTGIVMAIMFLTKRHAYFLFPAIAALTFLSLQSHHLEFKASGIKFFLVISLVVALITLPDFIFKYKYLGGFQLEIGIIQRTIRNLDNSIRTLNKKLKKIISAQNVALAENISPKLQKHKIREINYMPSNMINQPLNVPKYLGIPLLLLLLLFIVNIRRLFEIKDLILILPIIIYLPLFLIILKESLGVRYLAPILPLAVVLVSKLFLPREYSPQPYWANKGLRQLVLFLCILQFVSTLVFVYMSRQISPAERNAIQYIKNNISLDSRILTPDELFVSYYTQRATFWKDRSPFTADFFTVFWDSKEKIRTGLQKHGIDYMVIRKERIYDDTKIRYRMGGGFPQSFVERLPEIDFIKVFQNEEVSIWGVNY